MIEVFKRSWEITKVTLGVIKKDKELISFPILAGLFSILFIIIMIFPIILSLFMNMNFPGVKGVTLIFLIFVIYLGLAVIATFFNVCVVYTSKKRFEGGNATFIESIKFAFSKFHLIIAWGVVSAIIGLILRMIERTAQRMGHVGGLILRVINFTIGAAWSMITIFVIPGMVYHGYGPIDAIKNSAETFKKTWGENLVRIFGFGAIQFLFFIVGAMMGVLMLFLSIMIQSKIAIALSILMIIMYFVGIAIFFMLANTIYSTALYIYAEKGKIPEGYNSSVIKNAFEKNKENKF